jgi:hypothetical protein
VTELELFMGCMFAVALFVCGVLLLNVAQTYINGDWTWRGGKYWRPPTAAFGLSILALVLWAFGLYTILHLL